MKAECSFMPHGVQTTTSEEILLEAGLLVQGMLIHQG